MQAFSDRLDQRLLSQAKRLHQLTRLLQRELPPDCLGHYHVANIRNGSLHIITDSPVWTTRLRQLASTIIDILEQNCISQIQHVNISSRIHYQPARPPAKPVIKRRMSQKTSEQLLQSASCIEDEGLKNALAKLARRGQS